MDVRVSRMYSDDIDAKYYEDGDWIRTDSNVLSANFMILEDDDQNETLDKRDGKLSKSFVYELHDGQLCAIVDGKFILCDDDILFEYYLRKKDEEKV